MAENPFLEIEPTKEQNLFIETANPFLEVEAKNPFPKKEQESFFTSLLRDISRPFLRSGQIFEEEAKAGIGAIKEAVSEIDHPIKATIGSGPQALKAGLGALRTAFSPLTGIARGMVGEPAGQIAKELGAGPLTEQAVREGAEGLSIIFGPTLISKAAQARHALPFENPFTQIQSSFAIPKSVKAAHKVSDELAARTATTESIEKAERFLKTDLSKIDIPVPHADRQVNYSNYLITTDDVKRGIVAAEKIRGSTKKTISFSQIESEARNSNITIKDLLSRGEREGSSASQLEAYKMMLNSASRNVMGLRDKIMSGSAKDVDRAMFYSQFNEMMDMMRQFQGAKSEAGRALGILRKQSSASQLKVLQQLSDGKLVLKNGKKLEELGVSELAELTTAFETPAELAKFVESATKATTLEKVTWAWKSGLLTGLRTHEVNFLSNTLVNLIHFPERFGAASIGKILPGKDKVLFRELGAMVHGQLTGLKEGMRMAAQTLRYGATPESAAKVTDIQRLNPIGGKTGTFIGSPYRLLAAEDDIFRTTARHMELNALAMRQAVREGKKGSDLSNRVVELVENPTDELIDASKRFGDYSVFTKELGDVGKSAMRFARSHPALQFLFPFIRTPVNIVKFAGERTPFALASKAVRAEISKGGSARDLALSKILIGSGISSWAAMETMEGRMTGRGPVDPVQRKRWFDAGNKPYSMKIGNTWYPYNRIEPIGILFGYPADAVEIFKAATEDEKAKLGTMIAFSLSQNVTNKTFLVGATNAINAATDPDRYGEKWIQTLAGSFVPTISAEITQAKDPILRETESPRIHDDPVLREIDNLFSAIEARVITRSETLFPRRDIYGVPIKRHEGGLEAFSAVQPGRIKEDKAYTELVRLKLSIDNPDRKILGKELPIAVYDEYSQRSGEMAKRLVDRFVNNKHYDRIPKSEKEILIKDMFRTSQEIVRVQMGIATETEKRRVEDFVSGLSEF